MRSGLVLCVAFGVIGLLGVFSVALADEPPVFKTLDAVGPLSSDTYDPRPVIAAINELQAMGRKKGTATLAAYLEARKPGVNERGGLFAVLRVLYEPLDRKTLKAKEACTPRQTLVVDGGCLRPPMLGAPHPAAPEQLASLRFPFFVFGDVPLSVVSGYSLSGKAEPLYMHLESLSKARTGWLGAPLKPKTAGEIRYLITHYGQWNDNAAMLQALSKQLDRLETPKAP